MNKNTKIIVGLALSLVLAVGVAFGIMWLIPADSTDKDNTSQTTASTVTEDAPTEEDTESKPVEDKPTQTTKPVSATTTATTTRPAVTVVTTTPAVTAPTSTVRTDLPVVTAEPTTAATTATEPDIAVEYDDNGFPADPEPSETFKDYDGQWWIYNPIFGWGEWDGDGSTTMYEFPDNYDEIGSGEQILW